MPNTVKRVTRKDALKRANNLAKLLADLTGVRRTKGEPLSEYGARVTFAASQDPKLKEKVPIVLELMHLAWSDANSFKYLELNEEGTLLDKNIQSLLAAFADVRARIAELSLALHAFDTAHLPSAAHRRQLKELMEFCVAAYPEATLRQIEIIGLGTESPEPRLESYVETHIGNAPAWERETERIDENLLDALGFSDPEIHLAILGRTRAADRGAKVIRDRRAKRRKSKTPHFEALLFGGAE